jgi:hypothetical protein
MDLKKIVIKGLVKPSVQGIQKASEKALEAPGQAGPVVTQALGGRTAMQSIGAELIKVAKTSRQKLLEGPDGLITKDPVMRARYLPSRGARQGVNLRTIHDVNLNNFKKMDLTRQVEKGL